MARVLQLRLLPLLFLFLLVSVLVVTATQQDDANAIASDEQHSLNDQKHDDGTATTMPRFLMGSDDTPTGPTSPQMAPVEAPTNSQPCRQKLRTCPEEIDPLDRCKIPLSCNYEKIKCCGKTKFAKRCKCLKGGSFSCQSEKCPRVCGGKRPKKKVNVIKKCPAKKPNQSPGPVCAKALHCKYDQVKCCPNQMVPMYSTFCSCQKRKALECHHAPIRCPPCGANPGN